MYKCIREENMINLFCKFSYKYIMYVRHIFSQILLSCHFSQIPVMRCLCPIENFTYHIFIHGLNNIFQNNFQIGYNGTQFIKNSHRQSCVLFVIFFILNQIKHNICDVREKVNHVCLVLTACSGPGTPVSKICTWLRMP